jgi:hypothetical protein
VEVGADSRLTAPVYHGGALVAATGGTISIFDDANVAVIDGAAVTLDGGVAEYTVAAATTAARHPTEGWRAEWSITLTGGDVVRPRGLVYLVRRRLYPTISDVDVAQRVPSLALDNPARPTSVASYQGYIDEADTIVQSALIRKGRRPWLVLDPWALRECWLTKTLHLIYSSLSSTAAPGEVGYRDTADAYRDEYNVAWSEASVILDYDQDGFPEEMTRTPAKPPGVWLC